jgi:hypothetical protein
MRVTSEFLRVPITLVRLQNRYCSETGPSALCPITGLRREKRCLTDCRVRPKIFNGGSRKGSKGNAVRAPLDARNAAAAPATVSGESPADFATESDYALGKAA